MGAFASMAQNGYGMTIITGVCIGFGLVFLRQFFQQLKSKDQADKDSVAEFFALFFITAIITLRTLQVYIPFIEWVFAASGITLAGIYFRRMVDHFQKYLPKNRILAGLLLMSYLGIVLICLAMVTVSFNARYSNYLGILALVVMAGFLVGGFVNNQLITENGNTSVFRVIAGFRDRFYLLLSLFILFALYMGLTGFGFLPKLYSDKYPKAYYQMVSLAETGKEKPVNGEFTYEEFRKSYEQFVQRNLTSENK